MSLSQRHRPKRWSSTQATRVRRVHQALLVQKDPRAIQGLRGILGYREKMVRLVLPARTDHQVRQVKLARQGRKVCRDSVVPQDRKAALACRDRPAQPAQPVHREPPVRKARRVCKVRPEHRVRLGQPARQVRLVPRDPRAIRVCKEWMVIPALSVPPVLQDREDSPGRRDRRD